MRNEVTVDGVRLTRAQVEKAKVELDKPALKAGDKVWYQNVNDRSGKSDRIYIVLDRFGQNMAREGFLELYGCYPGEQIVFVVEERSGRLTWGDATHFEGLTKI